MRQLWAITTFLLALVFASASFAETSKSGETDVMSNKVDKHWSDWKTVKIAAGQVSIHTGTECDEMVSFIDRAGVDGAELIVLGEYILGPFPSENL